MTLSDPHCPPARCIRIGSGPKGPGTDTESHEPEADRFPGTDGNRSGTDRPSALLEAQNSTSARVVGRPFPPGTSGNPGGLRRDVRGRIERARRLALKLAPKAIATLGALLDDPDPSVRRQAAEGLLDRAGLRPFAYEPERVEVAHVVDVDGLRAALAARVEALASAGGVQVPPALPDAPAAAEATVEVSAAAHLPVEKVVAATKCQRDGGVARVEPTQGAEQGAIAPVRTRGTP